MITKNSIAELIYYILNYEKGRISTSLFWKNKYVSELFYSLKTVSDLLDILTKKKIDSQKTNSIKAYIEKNKGIVFPEFSSILTENEFDGVFYGDNIFNEEEKEVIGLMASIINRCIETLDKKKKGYKKEISYLLKALHNLPRALVDSKLCSIQHISCENAMEYAKSYLKQTRKLED